MTRTTSHRCRPVLASLALLGLLLMGPTPAALASDPSPTPAAGDQGVHRSGSTQLPRGLLLGLAGLAGAGTLVGLGAASVSVRERDDEPYDRFIDGPAR